MPEVPQHFDFPRFSHAKQSIDEWIDVFHKMLERQWTAAVQAYNAILKISTATDRPSVPFLDEALWYESDTGRSFIGVNGVWQAFSGLTGNTTTTSVSYTMLATDAIVLADTTTAALVVTANNGPTYAHRIRAVKWSAGSNGVTIWPSSGTIDGNPSFATSSLYDSILFTSDGTNLHIISRL